MKKHLALKHLLLVEWTNTKNNLDNLQTEEVKKLFKILSDHLKVEFNSERKVYQISTGLSQIDYAIEIPESSFQFYERGDGLSEEKVSNKPNEGRLSNNSKQARLLISQAARKFGIIIPESVLFTVQSEQIYDSSWISQKSNWLAVLLFILVSFGIYFVKPAMLTFIELCGTFVTYLILRLISGSWCVSFILGILPLARVFIDDHSSPNEAMAHCFAIFGLLTILVIERYEFKPKLTLFLGVVSAIPLVFSIKLGTVHLLMIWLLFHLNGLLSPRCFTRKSIISLNFGVLATLFIVFILYKNNIINESLNALSLSSGSYLLGAASLLVGIIYWFTGNHNYTIPLLIPIYIMGVSCLNSGQFYLSEISILVVMTLLFLSYFPLTQKDFIS